MNSPAINTPVRNARLLVLALFCLLVALVSRGIYLTRPFDPDAAMFIYMGRLVAEGGVYWRDLIDNKLPTVGFLTSPAWRAFGDWWGGYVLLQTGLSLLASLALARAAYRATGRGGAGWAAMLFSLVYLNLNTAVFGGFQLETLHVFFASLGAMAAINLLMILSRPRGEGKQAIEDDSRALVFNAVAVGLCGGCAALAKPTGLSIIAACALTLLFYIRQWWRVAHALAGLAAGVVFVGSIMLIYLSETGAIYYLPQVLRQIRLYSQNSATDLRDLNKLAYAAALLAFPLVSRGWVGRKHPPLQPPEIKGISPFIFSNIHGNSSHLHQLLKGLIPFIFAAVWLIIELIGVILQKRMYGYHFLVLIPPATLFFALLNRPATARSFIITLAPALILSVAGVYQIIFLSTPYQQRLEPADWLNAHAHPRDAVWRDLTARLLIETNLRPGSRYLLTFLFTNSDSAPQEYWAEMKHDFDGRKPRWIVLPNDLPAYLQGYTTFTAELERLPIRRANYLQAWAELEAYVHQHYHPVVTLSRETIWERSGEKTEDGSR